MKISQITPGLISIPPNGWGAVEKIIWNYKCFLETLGCEVNIKYLNDVNHYSQDILHIHVANLAIEAHKRGIPYIFSLHDHHVVYNGKSSITYKENLEAIKHSIISLTHAEFLVDYFEETDKLFYFPHGVDVDFFKKEDKNTSEHKLLCVANNGIGGDPSYDRKGFLIAIEAAKSLNLPLTIVGPENNNLFFSYHSEYLKYEKLTTIFTNPNEGELLRIYKDHTIFLHPSSLEAGHPNLTLLEALSSGLPVVGTYNGTKPIGGLVKVERNTESAINGIERAISNYNYLVQHIDETRDYYSWNNIAKKLLGLYDTVMKIKKQYTSEETKKLYIETFENTEMMDNSQSDIEIFTHYVDGPFVEIRGNSTKKYTVQYYDDLGVLHYQNTINSNMWCKLNRTYYTKWTLKIFEDDKEIYSNQLDLNNKRVLIGFESSSLGDTIAWVPYVEKFRKKHNCRVILSTFWNHLFEKLYPEIEFVQPGTVCDYLTASYKVGWFYNDDMEPQLPNTIPLQKTITNILGLDFEEIHSPIDFTPRTRPMEGRYITIATHSTAGLKYWNNPTGWQEVIDFLTSQNIKVVHVSKEPTNLKNVIQLNDTSIENTMNYIHHSELFIGLSSGLSWLAWGLNKRVIMISNFTEPNHEFTTNCHRIINKDVCNGCWNNPLFKFDKGNWNWCPLHEGTKRQFECHKEITSNMVIESLKQLSL